MSSAEINHLISQIKKIQNTLQNRLPPTDDFTLANNGLVRQGSKLSNEYNNESDLKLPPFHGISKELSTILDRKIEMKDESENVVNVAMLNCSDKVPLRLLTDVVLDVTRCNTKLSSADRRKLIKSKYDYYDSSDEELMKDRCKAVAVSPEWIVEKRGEFSWINPKNLRYLEEFVVHSRKENGSIIAIPISEKKKSKISTKLRPCVPKKVKNEKVLVTEENVMKKRKQKRYRSKKKKKVIETCLIGNINIECSSDPC